MNSLWVIPCKYDAARPVILDCVAAIQAHHNDPHIMVVDSNSKDTSYHLGLEHTYTSFNGNANYGPGAFKMAFEMYPDKDFFYFIFDSLIINDNLDDLMESELTTIRHFDYPENGWGWDEDGTPLDQWARDRGVVTPDAFSGVMGPMICAHRSVIEAADLFRILPTSAYEQCALERCWGIWLTEAGYDVTNSLQGPMHGFWDDYPEDRVKKIAMARP